MKPCEVKANKKKEVIKSVYLGWAKAQKAKKAKMPAMPGPVFDEALKFVGKKLRICEETAGKKQIWVSG